MLTERPAESLRTGALERGCAGDRRADASVLTRVDLAWIGDSV